MRRWRVVDHDQVGGHAIREAGQVGGAVASDDEGARRQRRKVECGVGRIVREPRRVMVEAESRDAALHVDAAGSIVRDSRQHQSQHVLSVCGGDQRRSREASPVELVIGSVEPGR